MQQMDAKHFVEAIDSLDEAVLVTDENAHFIYANKFASLYLGYSNEELLKLNILDIDATYKSMAGVKSKWDEIVSGSLNNRFETVHRCKNGELVPAEVLAFFSFRDGKPYCIGFVRDLKAKTQNEELENQVSTGNEKNKIYEILNLQLQASEKELREKNDELFRHQTELESQNEELRTIQAELEAAKQLYFDLYNQAPVGYCTLGDEQKITQVNLDIINMLGLEQRDMVAEPLTKFIAKEDQDAYYLFHKQLVTEFKEQSCELRMLKKDGATLWVHLTATFVTSENMAPTVRIVFTDISERKMAEDALRTLNQELLLRIDEGVTRRLQLEAERQQERDQLIQADKMAQLGNLLGVIIHQWKQPLNSIALEAQLIIERCKNGMDEKSLQCAINTIMEQVTFMSNTADDFRDFYKPSKERSCFSIKQQLDSVIELLSKQLVVNSINLSLKGDESICVEGLIGEFKQVVLNIINNAIDVFKAKNIKDAMMHIVVSKEVDNAVLTMTDNAGGIPTELLPDKLFKPFVTTRGDNGTGVGLSICKTIIEENMGGKLTVRNVDGGAEFKIVLPDAK